MELKYKYIVVIGILAIIFFTFVRIKKGIVYQGGKKIIENSLLKDNPYFKKKVLIYKILSACLFAACGCAFMSAIFLSARPFKYEVDDKGSNNRDIMFCIDVSSSLDEYNHELVCQLKQTVNNLRGNRFGIVIFNSSPVLLTPLTDDYDYVLEILSNIEKSLELRDNPSAMTQDDVGVSPSYYVDGTEDGFSSRGSSLVGDGLTAAAYDFPDVESERTKIIIMCTDNYVQGNPYVSLTNAADYCKEQEITIFGIGAGDMQECDEAQMSSAVKVTNGEFYRSESPDTIKNIVSSIERKEKTLVMDKKHVKTVELATVPFIFLVISTFIMAVLSKMTKR